ncbi:DUF2523 domain-containing protein [Salmonella enterica]
MSLLISVLGDILVFLFKQVIFKFILFTVIFLLLTEFAPLLTSYLPDGARISTLFTFLPNSVLWFLSITGFDVVFPMIILAYFTRFFIRRIPFLG